MMSRYKLGLATAHSQMRIGADVPGGDWNMSDYQDVAKAMWNAAPKNNGTAGVVILDKDGHLGGGRELLQQYPSGEEASRAYDQVVANPGAAWYIALFDDVAQKPGETALRDETYFGGLTQTVTQTVTKKQPIWPWLVGFLGLGAIYTASSKKKRGGL